MQKCRQKLVSLTIFLTLLPGVLFAQINCESLVTREPVIEKNPRLERVVKVKRARSLEKVSIQNLIVNGVKYHVLGLLGRSSSSVYLALTPQGQRVVIKHLVVNDDIDAEWINSIYYEVAVTEYYLSQGLVVPKIIDYEIIHENDDSQEGFLVKEYREGLTKREFLAAGGLTFLQGQNYRKLDEAYHISEKQMVEVHKGFQRWLVDNKINLHKHPFRSLNRLIQYGDHSVFGHLNWLFDTEVYQWVLFDP